jgi:hypothetical protein
VLVEQVTGALPDEYMAHKAIGYVAKVQRAPEAYKILRIGVMFNVENSIVTVLTRVLALRGHGRGGLLLGSWECSVRVIEVVGGVAKSIDFQFAEEALRNLVKEPVCY